jgi:hypothetical protein
MGLGAMASIGSSLSGNRPSYLNRVIEAMNFLSTVELCPEAKPYALLLYDIAVLSGVILMADTVVSTARTYGVNCELDSLGEATELLSKAIQLIKDRKATPEEALQLTNEVGRLADWLTFDATLCLSMSGMVGVSQENATG